MLKKHAERNSHASRVTVIVKETEPSLLSFVAIFFQTAPVFFFFFLSPHNRNGYPHIIHCLLFY